MEALGERLAAAAVLADDLRRNMYLFIRAQRRPVGRDEAAQAVGISPKLAAFHLDKMVEKGLLTARYARLTGRTGPGAGRPAKVYEPSAQHVSLSIPFRSYDVVGDILLDAIESPSGSTSTRAAMRAAARRRGSALGKMERDARGRRTVNKKAALAAAHEVLTERGYEPYHDDRGGLRLHNCPFHDLANRSPELVCGINESFINGLLSELGAGAVEGVLDPRPGECCVYVRPKEVVA